MSSASATTRSINRLHTKSKGSNYRPPPPPPTSSASPYTRQNMATDFATNVNHSETRSEVSVNNTTRQNNLGYAPLAPYNAISSSPIVYNQNQHENTQQMSRQTPQQGFHDQQQKPLTPHHFYNSQTLPQNYGDRNMQQNIAQPNVYNKQLNNVQHARPLSSVSSSSPNMMKGMNMTGISAPSPIVPSSASPYTNSNTMEYSNAVNGASYPNSTGQQNTVYGQHPSHRVPQVPNHVPPYIPNSSSQNSRVYTVNQPRPSPRNIPNQYPGNPPMNSSTPIRQQAPPSYGTPINSNGYHAVPTNIPATQYQSNFQGQSNVLRGSPYQKSNVVGLPNQFNRAPPSYQSPYSASTSNNVNQQHYPSNRGSVEQLDAKAHQQSSQNISGVNGNTPFNMLGGASHDHSTSNIYRQDINGTGRQTNSHQHGQPTHKGSYALPVSTCLSGHLSYPSHFYVH